MEVTVYLDEHAKGKGVGSSLYNRLFTALKIQNVHRALSGIALPCLTMHLLLYINALDLERSVYLMNTRRKTVIT